MVNVIQHFLSLTQSKRPKNNKSYDTLVKHHIDSLILLKLQFFRDITSVLQTYLTQFQSDVLLVSFINDEMVQPFTKTMRLFIKQNVLEEASSNYKLINIGANHKIAYSDQQFTSEEQLLQRGKNKISWRLCGHIKIILKL